MLNYFFKALWHRAVPASATFIPKFQSLSHSAPHTFWQFLTVCVCVCACVCVCVCVCVCSLLSGNPLHCSCENMWIKLWLGEEAENQDLRCIEDGGARKPLHRLSLPNCGKDTHTHTHTQTCINPQSKELKKRFTSCSSVASAENSNLNDFLYKYPLKCLFWLCVFSCALHVSDNNPLCAVHDCVCLYVCVGLSAGHTLY